MEKENNDSIIIKGAKVNNLKNVNLVIPKNKFIVFTGLSGSGKSSLAFDTIFAEGHRRYVESLSSYSRQFLGGIEKPDVESIVGLSPSIAIDQKSTTKNPRSTVGTITEIYDYLRLFYARVGTPHCPICDMEICGQTVDQIVDKIISFENNTQIMILSPIVRGHKGKFNCEIENILKDGYSRIRLDGEIINISKNKLNIQKNKKHNLEIIIDKVIISDFENIKNNNVPMHGFGNITEDNLIELIKERKKEFRSRISQCVESAINLSGGLVFINLVDKNEDIIFSKNYSCPIHDISISEIEPRIFSFNSPFGACKRCSGLGIINEVDENLVIPNKDFSINDGAITCEQLLNFGNKIYLDDVYEFFSKKYKFSLDTPIKNIKKEIINEILYGFSKNNESNIQKKLLKNFYGIINNLNKRFKETSSDIIREEIKFYMKEKICPDCLGKKLMPISLCVKIENVGIYDFCEQNINESIKFIKNLNFKGKKKLISLPILNEIKLRLNFLKNIGLGYLTLNRVSNTLSGGESQRIRLASQIGSALSGVIYVLDEPSIGLHPKDNKKLINALFNLRNLGNTLIVVEHDEETIRSCDLIVDIGPCAGVNGGYIVAVGNLEDIKNEPKSITGQYFSGKKNIKVPKKRNPGNGYLLKIKNVYKNNLKNINVEFKLGVINVVTGVSGSGKSTLVNDVLYNHVKDKLIGYDNYNKKKEFDEITGIEKINKVISVDQSPIGRTPRSNPATYIGLFTDIREIFALTNDSQILGFTNRRFSFNVPGGRCEACRGDGSIKVEMHFLPDIYVKCEVCNGRRYNRETLSVRYKGKNINDVLEMTVNEAYDFFYNVPKLKRKLEVLNEIGLSYIKLGQSSTTLSGGEAQRVKLASELSKPLTSNCLYVLDEPTTGLHVADVDKLIIALKKLSDMGNTLIIIEHNLDLIKIADHIIDLGPDGGDKGGQVVAFGTPEEICKVKNSYTAKYLKEYL